MVLLTKIPFGFINLCQRNQFFKKFGQNLCDNPILMNSSSSTKYFFLKGQHFNFSFHHFQFSFPFSFSYSSSTVQFLLCSAHFSVQMAFAFSLSIFSSHFHLSFHLFLCLQTRRHFSSNVCIRNLYHFYRFINFPLFKNIYFCSF